MKNKKTLIIGIVVLVVILAVAGVLFLNKKPAEKPVEKPKNTLSNNYMTINGIYLNNGHVNDEGLKQVVVFYTVKAGDKNLDLSCREFSLKINNTNVYSATIESDTPNYTEYYYSDIIENIYVGKTLNMAATFDVPEGDLIPGKEIVLEGSNNLAAGIKFKTDDIKRKENYDEISKDIAPETYAKKKAEKDEAMSAADEATTNKVKNAVNGYYFEMSTFVGQAYISYKLDFAAPNNFTVTSYVGGGQISNTGTYDVRKGYIIVTYSNDSSKTLEIPYSFEASGEISLGNPFISNGSDKIF